VGLGCSKGLVSVLIGREYLLAEVRGGEEKGRGGEEKERGGEEKEKGGEKKGRGGRRKQYILFLIFKGPLSGTNSSHHLVVWCTSSFAILLISSCSSDGLISLSNTTLFPAPPRTSGTTLTFGTLGLEPLIACSCWACRRRLSAWICCACGVPTGVGDPGIRSKGAPPPMVA